MFVSKDDKEKRSIAENFYKKNLKNRKYSSSQDPNKWCSRHLSNVNGKTYSYKDVVCALPTELMELKDYLDQKEIDSDKKDSDINQSDIQSLKYIKDRLYEDMTHDAMIYLYKTVSGKVCPYCNRNYVYVDGRVRGCDFDHFLPKSKYPLLAASFYNLIPACPICNRFKKDGLFYFFPHKEYDYGLLPHFRVWLKSDDYRTNTESIEIEIDCRKCPSFEKDINSLKLRTLYNAHRDVVQEVLICKETYSESYLSELAESFERYGLTKERMMEIVYNIPSSPEQFSDKPLSKLRYEVWYMSEGQK